jgi:hypothetical protein
MTSCRQQVEGKKMLSQQEAIEVAKKVFADQGNDVADYDVNVETYHRDEQKWIVWFNKSGPFPIPGGKHAVVVHKSTGATVFMPGE